MITLHGFGKYFGVNDPSPMVLKVDAYMRFAKINFTTNSDSSNLKTAPKGKLPYINDAGKNIADSQFIIEYLKKNYVDLDADLNSEQKAIAYLITKSLDENLYFCTAYSRWLCDDTWPLIKKTFFGNLPPVVKTLVPKLVRKKIKANLYAQGLTRHSHAEILHISKQSFQALSDLLADKKYFFGDNPSSLDASAYGMLASFISVDFDNSFNQIARSFPNLVQYCQAIEKNYF